MMKKRGELIERSFAHNYDTGAMRRTHLRHHGNIQKRLLVHVGGFNLSLVMRKLIGRGTPRGLQGLFSSIIWFLGMLQAAMGTIRRDFGASGRENGFLARLKLAA